MRPAIGMRGHAIGLVAAIVVAVANFAWIASDLGVLHPPAAVLETDHHRYIEISKGPRHRDRPELARQRPFSHRIVVPAVVRAATAIGVDRDVAFFALTQLSLVGFLYVLSLLLAESGASDRDRVIGVALAGACPGAVRWYSYQYWMTDPLALLAVAVAIWLIRRDATRSVFALTVIGVATRETFLLVVPYFVLYRWRTRGAADAVRIGLGLAAWATGVWITLQLVVPAAPGAPIDVLIAEVTRWRLANLFENQLYFATLGSFGVLLPLLLATPRRTLDHFLRHWEDAVVVAAVYGSLLLARNTDRLLVYALPVLLPVAVANLRWCVDRARGFGPAVLAAVGLAQAVFYVQTLTVGVPLISIRQPARPAVVAVMFVAWAVAFAAARGRASAPRAT